MISGEGKHYLVKGSGYDQVQKMDQWSNSNQAGVWLFKIGQESPTYSFFYFLHY